MILKGSHFITLMVFLEPKAPFLEKFVSESCIFSGGVMRNYEGHGLGRRTCMDEGGQIM